MTEHAWLDMGAEYLHRDEMAGVGVTAEDLAELDALELRLAVAEATAAVQRAVDAADALDDPGPYHRLEAVLEALRGILADVERP